MTKYIRKRLPCALLLALLMWAALQAVEIGQLRADVQDAIEGAIVLQSETAALHSIAEQRVQLVAISTSECEPVPEFTPNPEIPLDSDIQEHLHSVAEQYGVPDRILLAIMEHESNYQADALRYNRNGTHDSGLMQINSVNHGWLLEEHGLNVKIPEDNIEAAAVILSGFMERYTMTESLAAYAVGEFGMLAGGGKWFAEWIMERSITDGHI